MHIFFTMLVMGIAIPLLVRAGELPELTEWWSIDSPKIGIGFSYLPDFDVTHGGHHALAVQARNYDSASTWYTRYYGDTMSHFNWPYREITTITVADLNGDGAKDYVTRTGLLYPGENTVSPPISTRISKVYFALVVTPGVQRIAMDFNNDGYDDILSLRNDPLENRIFTVLLGGPDLEKLKYVHQPYHKDYVLGDLLGTFQKQSTESVTKQVYLRSEPIIVQGSTYAKSYSLILREMKMENVGDTVSIAFTTLDSLWLPGYNPDQGTWKILPSALMLRNRKTNKEYLVIQSTYRVPATHSEQCFTILYDIENNKLRKVQTLTFKNPYSLPVIRPVGDINGDGYDDWCVFEWNDGFYFYRGLTQGIDTLPFARYSYNSSQLSLSVGFEMCGIGDVTGDGIEDCAITIGSNSSNGRFSIIAGQAIQPVGVHEQPVTIVHRTFNMQQSYPNPVGVERQFTVQITVEKTQHLALELWTTDGKKAGTLHSEWIPTGQHQFTISLLPYHLSSGMYLLRLVSAEGIIHERGILLM